MKRKTKRKPKRKPAISFTEIQMRALRFARAQGSVSAYSPVVGAKGPGQFHGGVLAWMAKARLFAKHKGEHGAFYTLTEKGSNALQRQSGLPSDATQAQAVKAQKRMHALRTSRRATVNMTPIVGGGTQIDITPISGGVRIRYGQVELTIYSGAK